MKKKLSALLGAALMLSMATTAFAAETPQASQPVGASAVVCYPTAVTRSEDGNQIRKMYDLGPTDDPAGIPRSDFEQDGFHYVLVDLLKQELPEQESRQHTETVSVASKSKDMATVLNLLPQTKEFREQLNAAVLDAYQQEMAQLTQRGQTPPSQEPPAPEMTM